MKRKRANAYPRLFDDRAVGEIRPERVEVLEEQVGLLLRASARRRRNRITEGSVAARWASRSPKSVSAVTMTRWSRRAWSKTASSAASSAMAVGRLHVDRVVASVGQHLGQPWGEARVLPPSRSCTLPV